MGLKEGQRFRTHPGEGQESETGEVIAVGVDTTEIPSYVLKFDGDPPMLQIVGYSIIDTLVRTGGITPIED